MPDEVVRLEDVWVSFNGTSVLEGVSLVVEPRDFLGVIGPNGGGKTTLLKVMLGLIKPDRGKIRVLGRPPGKSHYGIGYIPQKALFDRTFPLSVEEAVLMGRYGNVGLFRRYSAEDRRITLEALETVKMAEYRGRQIGQLSGGQQQRVFIARALASDPRLLLLDEPTESVDPTMQADFYELLQKLRERMAIVLVSHDISAISVYVEKIACLNRQLAYHGTKDISPETLEKTYQCPIRLIAHGPLH